MPQVWQAKGANLEIWGHYAAKPSRPAWPGSCEVRLDTGVGGIRWDCAGFGVLTRG